MIAVSLVLLAVFLKAHWPGSLQAWNLLPYRGLIQAQPVCSLESARATGPVYTDWMRGLNNLSTDQRSTPAAPSVPGASPSLADRTLLFSEDFDGSSLDSSKWNPHYWWRDDGGGCTIAPNNELEWYQPDDVLLSDGILRLRAQERTVISDDGTTYDYTSGVVTTGKECWESPEPDKFAFLYGYAEARLRMPAGQGLWPAFWLLSCDQEWPPEIDVMEIIGNDTNTTHMTVHYLDGEGTHRSGGGEWIGPDFSEGWHTFAVDWRPDAIIWYVDGIERWRYMDAAHIPAEPMYLVLNLAVGGDWPGPPDASTEFPNYFEVDHVRVWSSSVIDPGALDDQAFLPTISKAS